MADGIELGTAFVTILPELSRLGSGIRQALSEASGDVESAGRSLGHTLGVSLTGALKDPVSSLTTMLGNLGSVGGDGALGLSSGAVAAAGVIGGIGAATVAVTAELYNMGSAWAEIADNIAWQTGAIGDRMAELSQAAGELSTKVAQTPEQLANTMGQLADGPLKLTDTQLKSLTFTLGQYNEHHPDAIANTQALTQVFLEFGVPAASMVDTLDQLNLVAEHTKIPFNTLAQELAALGPTADLLGISLGQTTNLLKNLALAGIDPNTAITSLRVGLKNLVDDNKKLQDVMGGSFAPDESALDRLKQTVDMIEQLHQKAVETGDQTYEIQAQDIGNSVFGRGWTAIVDAIEKGRLTAHSLGDTAREQGPSIDTLTQATEHFKEKWQETGNDIKLALKPLSDDVFKVIDDGLTSFDDHLKAVLAHPEWSILQKLQMLNLGGPSLLPTEPGAGIQGGGGPGAQAERRSGAAGGVPGAGGPLPPLGPIEGSEKPARGAGGYSIDTSAAFYPLDLNAADMPAGEKYDSWISKQKQVQSALQRRDDANTAVAVAQEKQAELLAKGNATEGEKNSVAEQLAKAQRAQLEATQDLTIAQDKLAKGADDTTKAFHLSGGGFIGDLINLIAAMVTDSNNAVKAAQGGSASPAGTIPAIAAGGPPLVSSGGGGGIPGATPPAAPSGNGVTYSGGAGTGNLLGPPLPGNATLSSSAIPLIQRPDGSWTSTDPAWAHLINRESGGRNIIQSPSTQDVNSGGNEAFGIFQITPGTWASHGGQGSVYNSTPQQQAEVAARILRSNPSGSDWGAGLAGRENAAALLAALKPPLYVSGGAVDTVPAMLTPGEHVLTTDDVTALGGQQGVYALRQSLHFADGGAVIDELLKKKSGGSSGSGSGAGRTQGFIPTGAASQGTPGSGMWSGFMNLGDEVVNSLIDQGVQAAEAAVSAGVAAGSFGAAGTAGGAAANLGLGIAAQAGKVGAKYGFSLAGIAGDSLLEIFSPFGTPRWLGYPVANYLPNLSNVAQPVSTLEKALAEQQRLQAGGGAPGADQSHPGLGAAPGPGGPVTPSTMAGRSQVGPPTSLSAPKTPAPTSTPPGGQPPPPKPASPPQHPPTQSTTDPLAQLRSILGFDQGGMLPPGGIGVNMTAKPEPVFTDAQWSALNVAAPDANTGGHNFGVTIQNLYATDAQDVKRQIDAQQKLATLRYAGRP